jgi:hypothetical protein
VERRASVVRAPAVSPTARQRDPLDHHGDRVRRRSSPARARARARSRSADRAAATCSGSGYRNAGASHGSTSTTAVPRRASLDPLRVGAHRFVPFFFGFTGSGAADPAGGAVWTRRAPPRVGRGLAARRPRCHAHVRLRAILRAASSSSRSRSASVIDAGSGGTSASGARARSQSCTRRRIRASAIKRSGVSGTCRCPAREDAPRRVFSLIPRRLHHGATVAHPASPGGRPHVGRVSTRARGAYEVGSTRSTAGSGVLLGVARRGHGWRRRRRQLAPHSGSVLIWFGG